MFQGIIECCIGNQNGAAGGLDRLIVEPGCYDIDTSAP
jgi:hypothetical protein